ncbi:MAG: Uma2 family endonuclease [Pirellula sp.]
MSTVEVSKAKAYEHGMVPSTLEHQLQELGDIPANRVLQHPSPGTATLDDLMRVNESSKHLCELVDGTLVEKAVGYKQSVVAMTIGRILGSFVSMNKLGLISGADGFFRLQSTTRGPDVAFVHRDRFQHGKLPTDLYPSVAPNLVVEVLSDGNTRGEMNRKRLEYFHAGVQLVWIVDLANRTIAIYRSSSSYRLVGEEDLINGEDVLPGFECKVQEFFEDLDQIEA